MKKSRQAAIQAGERYYLTGKLCLNNHISKRGTIDGSCCQCKAKYAREKRQMIQAAFLKNESK